MLPLKLEKLHLCKVASFRVSRKACDDRGTFAVLPNRLPIRTLYLKYVERLEMIIQRLESLIYKDFVSKMYISLPVKTGSSSTELARLYPWVKTAGLYAPLS